MDDYFKIIDEKIVNDNSKLIMKNQVDLFFDSRNFNLNSHKYEIGDEVFLKKGKLLHGTYRNLEGLEDIVKNGLISSLFVGGRLSKYLCSVSVWNLKNDCLLKDYINLYSGGTIKYCGVFDGDIDTQENKTEIISYDDLSNINEIVKNNPCHMWSMEQTKEARFLPSLVQDRVQVGIIYDSHNEYIKNLLNGDILTNSISDDDVKDFVNPDYYETFIKNRNNKDDFFTDRESAILFGIPSNFIEGILVGRKYENNKEILNKIKSLLPDCYICNLDGIVIVK